MAERSQEQNSNVTDVPSAWSPGASGAATLAEGENVSQQFINSMVNVVNGDQINVSNYIMNTTGEASAADQNACLALIQSINENTSRTTVDKILEDFADEDFNKPDFQVHPQMRKVTRSEYFKGNYEEVREKEVASKRKLLFWKKKEVVKNQIRKEFGFLRQKVSDNKFIELDEVLQQVINDKSSVTAIVASAGSGKTTLMRRIAGRTLPHSLTNTEAITSPSQLHYKLVHYIEIKGMRDKGLIKPSKFLFDGLFGNDVNEDHAYQWLLDHQSEAVLFFDGLDQATWKINRTGDENINPYTPAEAATIMYNILSRKLLAGTKIVISSREFQVSDLPVEARPAGIIKLCGLTLDDAKKLFVFLIRGHGDKAWQKIEKMSPRLINLVSIPVFLILTAVIMAKNPDEPPPETVTGLYKKIISSLSSVKNITQADAIARIINKLKAMAYRGMVEGRVTFSEDDLEKFGLSKDEVQDLMLKVPGNNLLSCNLLDGSFIFFFCHQSLQEFLAAGFVAEKSIIRFRSFNYEDLHKERWLVVRRFVCGIIYDETLDNLHDVSSRSMKKRFLGESIRSQLKENKNNMHFRLELYAAIYESGDDDLMKEISDIDAAGTSLSRDGANIVGSLAAKREKLEFLNISECNINDELLAIITACLEKRTEVKILYLDDNNFSAKALSSLLGHRGIESLSGKLNWEVVKLTIGRHRVELKNEKNVINISGRKVKGHYNITNSTLLFQMVPCAAAGVYFKELFDLDSFTLRVDKRDDLLELSEHRLEKVILDLRVDNIAAKELRSLLAHSWIESFSGKWEWKVVKLTVDGILVELKNGEDVIKMTCLKGEGHFNITDRTLLFRMSLSLKELTFFDDLFDAESVKFIEELYENLDAGSQRLSMCKIEKVNKVDFKDKHFSPKELRSFLGHRRIESLSGKLDWEVVKLTVDGILVELKNGEDVIKMTCLKGEGHFNITV